MRWKCETLRGLHALPASSSWTTFLSCVSAMAAVRHRHGTHMLHVTAGSAFNRLMCLRVLFPWCAYSIPPRRRHVTYAATASHMPNPTGARPPTIGVPYPVVNTTVTTHNSITSTYQRSNTTIAHQETTTSPVLSPCLPVPHAVPHSLPGYPHTLWVAAPSLVARYARVCVCVCVCVCRWTTKHSATSISPPPPVPSLLPPPSPSLFLCRRLRFVRALGGGGAL